MLGTYGSGREIVFYETDDNDRKVREFAFKTSPRGAYYGSGNALSLVVVALKRDFFDSLDDTDIRNLLLEMDFDYAKDGSEFQTTEIPAKYLNLSNPQIQVRKIWHFVEGGKAKSIKGLRERKTKKKVGLK